MPSPPSPPERTAVPLESPFQEPGTQVTVILPEQPARRIVLALPVEKGDGHKYGHALAEIGRLPAALRAGTVFAAPTFSASPWLVNHATRTDRRQEDHLVRVVVPTVLALLDAQAARLPVHLLGFSKGGFAALNLLTRHPALFAAASVWDPSLLSDRPPHPQLADAAGSTGRLDEYDVRLNLRRHGGALRAACRIALGGIGTLEADWTAGHRLLDSLGIPHHAYRDAPADHRWDAAWLAPAMRHLLTLETRLHHGPARGEGGKREGLSP
ncbi:alpha/beta hydrolase-fold protein [Streptomyces sp. NPDC059255]|uniref:alpha/beta hydrolase-fold protein n=1 Tax=Streptomyces sp. NPDC059255 TaxID=3346793 RepID=UPI0036AA84E6